MQIPRLPLLSMLFFAAAFSGCKKEDNDNTIDFGPSPGFQYRNTQNVPMGGDPTDWTADGPWNSREKELFATLNLSLDQPQQTGTWFSSVYPNQSEAASGFVFQNSVSSNKPAPAGSRMALVIVDRRYKELLRQDVASGTTLSFQPNALAAGALYRLYYVCYVPGQRVYFRSHGDIKVE